MRQAARGVELAAGSYLLEHVIPGARVRRGRHAFPHAIGSRSSRAVLLSALVAASGCGPDLPPDFGDPIPDAEFEVIDATGSDWHVGQRVRLSDLDHEAVILDFWASWCGPCRGQHGFVSELVEQYGDHIQAVGILYEDTPENAREWLEVQGATYPTVREVGDVLESTFWLRGIPRFVMLDNDRRLAWDMMGMWGTDSVIVRLDDLVARKSRATTP